MAFDDEVYIEGLFKRELKNRFVCQVLVNNEVEECYVPNSARLENFIPRLKNRKVLLMPNKGKNVRTKYSLFAVKYYKRFIILNLNLVNRYIEKAILDNTIKLGSYDNIIREKMVNGYKADFILSGEENSVVEVKTIVSTDETAYFPSVYSERAVGQLYRIRDLLLNGWEAYYLLVSLSPTVKNIEINAKQKEFYDIFMRCIEAGMTIININCNFDGRKICIQVKETLENYKNI